jgi:hypothetical protein
VEAYAKLVAIAEFGMTSSEAYCVLQDKKTVGSMALTALFVFEQY